MTGRFSRRLIFAAVFFACAGLLAFGYYLQYVQHLEPCPMCIFQRLAYFGIAAIALVAALHGPAAVGTRVYGALTLIVSLKGGAIAARQTWLQHLPPDQVPECGPGLDFMLEVYPLWEVVQKALVGTGDCATVNWRFLGLSIAEWSLMCFAGFTVLSAVLLFRQYWIVRASPIP